MKVTKKSTMAAVMAGAVLSLSAMGSVTALAEETPTPETPKNLMYQLTPEEAEKFQAEYPEESGVKVVGGDNEAEKSEKPSIHVQKEEVTKAVSTPDGVYVVTEADEKAFNDKVAEKARKADEAKAKAEKDGTKVAEPQGDHAKDEAAKARDTKNMLKATIDKNGNFYSQHPADYDQWVSAKAGKVGGYEWASIGSYQQLVDAKIVPFKDGKEAKEALRTDGGKAIMDYYNAQPDAESKAKVYSALLGFESTSREDAQRRINNDIKKVEKLFGQKDTVEVNTLTKLVKEGGRYINTTKTIPVKVEDNRLIPQSTFGDKIAESSVNLSAIAAGQNPDEVLPQVEGATGVVAESIPEEVVKKVEEKVASEQPEPVK